MQFAENFSLSGRLAEHVIEASPCMMYIFDIRERRIVFVNSGIAAMLGYSRETDVKEAEFIRSVLHPDDWQPFLDYLCRLANLPDKETAEFEYRMRHSSGIWRWFHSHDKVFTRDEDGTVRKTIGTATDITERKDTEEKVRFIADLSHALLPLADPEQIMAVAVRMVGEYLDVDRCVYAEVEADAGQVAIMGEYTRGAIPHIAGRYRISDFGEKERQVLRENEVYVVNDIETESPPGTDLSLYRRGGIRSLVCVPLNKGGSFVARMAAHQSTPRSWSTAEIELLRKVASRCWESVERARALRRLKESDDRYRAFIGNSSEAIWRFEFEQPIPLAISVDEQIEMLYKFGYLAECNDAMARMYGYDSADQIVGARVGDLMPRSDPQNLAYLQALRRNDYRLTDFETHEVDRYGNTKYFLNNLTAVRENGTLVRGWGMQRDITEQKRAADALRASEERLRRITDATQDALWEIDLKTNHLWWSEAARPLFGRSPGELQIGLEDWYQGIHPEDVDRVRTQFESFMWGSDSDWADEYRFRRADGSYIYIEDQGRKFFDETGAPLRIAGAMVDITERKLAEAAVRESEEQYRLLTELSPDGVVITGADGTIQLANPAMLRILGAVVEDVAGRNIFEFVAPDYLDQCRNCMRVLMTNSGTPTQVEAEFRRKDGRNVPVEVSAVRFEHKGQPFAQIVVHDISGRKQAEAERQRLSAEIEAERDRLRQILDQMPIGVGIAEAPSGRLLFNNLEAVRLLRHPLPFPRDSMGYTQFGALHEDGSPYRREEYPGVRSMMSKEVIKGEEMRYRRGDGTETFFSVNCAPIYDSQGRMVLVVATFFDIAERKRAEKELRESEERFAKAFQASPDALVISRIADGVILEVNDSFVKMSGYARDDLIGKSTVPLGLYADPADRERAVAILKDEHRVRDFEFEMKKKTGEVFLMTFSAEPLELHGEHCWLTIGRDITAQKQAEEARRKSEEEARRHLAYVEAIYATAPVGLCFVDTDLRFRSINERLAEMNGKSVQEHIGHTLREVVPQVADVVEPYYRRVIESGEPVLNVETKSAAIQGPVHYFVVSYYPVKDRKERVLGVNVVVVDITQRKQVEEEREKLLEQEKAAREDAEAANRMKDEFLATISHELRTPLTSILGWARILGDNQLSESQTRHALQVIERSAKSQTELIDEILDTSRIITGRLKLDARPVEIAQVFQAAIEVIRPSAEAKRIDLQTAIEDRGSLVLGDANRLQQAIWNLLSNAVKFTNEGGRIEGRMTRAGAQVEISIDDTGLGIEPQFLPYVFDRFRQADSTSTRKYGGLGLGLAIVRHVVEMHGGSVSASSPGKGQGSTFKIRFPVASPARLRQQQESQAREAKLKRLSEPTPSEQCQTLDGARVLVVEDDLDTLEMLRFILEKCGAKVITATSTREALEVLDRCKPHALVSDLAMPDEDGYELISKVRSREAERGGKIPAVALTAYARAEDRARALAAGFQMHVPKPVDPEAFVAAVANLAGLVHFS
jgi:PAS domain S-box-containing protein